MLEVTLFSLFVIAVVGLGLYQGNKTLGTSTDNEASSYFLAGRGLTWWLVGFSLIAANISTEQFVGMSGKAADWLGMAIASYEWMAAVTLVIVAFVFLPKFLRAGIYTAPEFLEYRYGWPSRLVMAIATLVILVGVPTASVIFSGAKVVSVYYSDVPVLGSLPQACWLIAVLAAVYVFIGGLKACAWTDLIWGASLIVGGAVVAYLAFAALSEMPAEQLVKTAATPVAEADIEEASGWERFQLLNAGTAEEGGKLHMRRPIDDAEIPWTALVLGLWIPNFFYWGLNQYIIQRTLGSRSLAEGQKGIVFAAFLKLVIPFVVVIPGVLAYNMYSGDLHAAAEANAQAAMESANQTEALSVSPSFVELNPELAGKVFAVNASLAAEQVTMDASMSAAELAEEINRLHDLAIKNGAPAGASLVGYDYDSAFPVLLRNLLKPKPMVSWFVLAAIFGAVVSSLASMLNSASTIATIDLYQKFNPDASQRRLVAIGRLFVVIFVVIAAFIAPMLASPKFGGIFTFIQEFQGFISPGVLAVFLFGVLVPRAPRFLGWSGILLNAFLYGALKFGLSDAITRSGFWFASDISFLDRMGICFVIVIAYCTLMTLLRPLPEPVRLPENENIDLESSGTAKVLGGCVILLTAILYWMFW